MNSLFYIDKTGNSSTLKECVWVDQEDNDVNGSSNNEIHFTYNFKIQESFATSIPIFKQKIKPKTYSSPLLPSEIFPSKSGVLISGTSGKVCFFNIYNEKYDYLLKKSNGKIIYTDSDNIIILYKNFLHLNRIEGNQLRCIRKLNIPNVKYAEINKSTIITLMKDGSIKLFEINSFQLIFEYKLDFKILFFKYHSHFNLIIGITDSKLFAINLDNFSCKTCNLKNGTKATSMAISNNKVYIGFSSGFIAIYNIQGLDFLKERSVLKIPIDNIVGHENSEYIACFNKSAKGSLRILDSIGNIQSKEILQYKRVSSACFINFETLIIACPTIGLIVYKIN